MNVITGGNLSGPTSPLSTKQVLANLGLDEDSDSNKPKKDQQTARMFKNTNTTKTDDSKESSIFGSVVGKISNVKIDPKMFSANTLNYDYSFYGFFNRFVLPLFNIQ